MGGDPGAYASGVQWISIGGGAGTSRCYPSAMGLLRDVTALLSRYPISFIAMGAVGAAAVPVASVALGPALRPIARRVLARALAVRSEALRVAAESREAYADLLAEAEQEAAEMEQRAERAPSAQPVQRADPAPRRGDPAFDGCAPVMS